MSTETPAREPADTESRETDTELREPERTAHREADPDELQPFTEQLSQQLGGVKGVVEAARTSGVQWHIIEEESPEPDKNVPAGLAYLKSLAGGPKS